MVVREIPGAASRCFQTPLDRVHELHGGADGCPSIGGVARVERALELIERAGRGRRALVKQPESAAQDRAARFRQQRRRANSRSEVHTVDYPIAIEAAAELRKPSGARLKPVLHEEREVRTADRLRRGRAEGELSGKRAVGPLDEHWAAVAR